MAAGWLAAASAAAAALAAVRRRHGGGGGGLKFITQINNMAEVSQAAMNYFMALGVDLDPMRNPGKAVFFNDRQGMLLVRATMQDLDIIEAAIQVLNIVPPQVNIKSKFVEVAQDDQKALGFDWYLGNVLMNNGSIVGPGGTAPSFNGTPTAANPLGTFPGNAAAGTTIAPSSTDQQIDLRPAQSVHDALHAYRHPDGPAISHGHPRPAAAARGGTAGSARGHHPKRPAGADEGHRRQDHHHRL